MLVFCFSVENENVIPGLMKHGELKYILFFSERLLFRVIMRYCSLISNCIIVSAFQEAIPFFSFESKVSHLVRKVKLRKVRM